MNYADQNFVTILIYDRSLRVAFYFEIYQMLCAFNFLWGCCDLHGLTWTPPKRHPLCIWRKVICSGAGIVGTLWKNWGLPELTETNFGNRFMWRVPCVFSLARDAPKTQMEMGFGLVLDPATRGLSGCLLSFNLFKQFKFSYNTWGLGTDQ